jgi:lipopolysaccharide/colanic/teichoic acid biosynthesis glycosyltransferase
MGIETVGDIAGARTGRYLHYGTLMLAGKRAFDLIVAGVGLVVAAPLFLAIAVAIKRDTPGPVFFRQVRVGRKRRPFEMWKFRKMPHDLPEQGPMLTARDDRRLTRVGYWLERTKLDELPQLLNVLCGEMSVVGPRPEVPKFVDRATPDLYPPGCPDVEAFYLHHILPEKLAVDARYAQEWWWLGDCWLLLRGVVASAFGVAPRS